jgi:hypothetical protein
MPDIRGCSHTPTAGGSGCDARRYHHPGGNSYIERFHRSLKEEEVDRPSLVSGIQVDRKWCQPPQKPWCRGDERPHEPAEVRLPARFAIICAAFPCFRVFGAKEKLTERPHILATRSQSRDFRDSSRNREKARMGFRPLVPFQAAEEGKPLHSWERSCPHRWIVRFDRAGWGAEKILEPGARKSQ